MPAGHLAPPPLDQRDARADEDVRVDELYNVSAYQGRISLILNGHSHSYQRFASMLADGRIDPTHRAPRSITVGTGSAQLVPFTAPARTGTRCGTASHHGVLRVRLDPGRWTSEFDTTDGTVLDRASAGC